jgi:hypothetical protein
MCIRNVENQILFRQHFIYCSWQTFTVRSTFVNANVLKWFVEGRSNVEARYAKSKNIENVHNLQGLGTPRRG